MVEKIERNIRNLFDAPVTVFTHLEPVEDPVSMHDIGIDRDDTKDEIPLLIRKK
jgi:hypothetical protein